jgi:hypothetical protein
MEMYVTDFTIGPDLSQQEDRVQPVALYCRKMIARELNYDISDKEMLTIDSSFKDRKRYLEGAEHSIVVFKNY